MAASARSEMGEATRPDRRAKGGEGLLSESVCVELNRLRNENAEFGRDVLIRAAALWVKEAIGS
jgi:hypothetical protein